jgi:peptidoglycan/LPS O-acetylase OafA/YrhL
MNPPPQPGVRYRSLDFWRGVACLQVIVFHSTHYMVAGGSGPAWFWETLEFALRRFWAGVPLFFVISGYCIAAAVASAARRGTAPLDFYFRRFRRIYPPYWICLALFVVVIGLGESAPVGDWLGVRGLWTDQHHPIKHPAELSVGQWLGNLTLTESWRYQVFEGRQQAERVYFLGIIWTLCYEEQFYLIMGLVLIAFPQRIFLASLGVTFLAILARHTFPDVKLGVAGFFYDGHWNVFAMGLLVYYHLHVAKSAHAWITWLLFGLAVAYAFHDKSSRGWGYSPENALLIGVVFALLLIWLHPYDQTLPELAWLRPISWCGVMSYSLYLTHWPITKAISHLCFQWGCETPAETLAVSVPLCLVASLLCGAGFHYTIERRFLNVSTVSGTP